MNVFTYGTLQVAQVWQAVAGKSFKTVAGQATGYRVRQMAGADYPGMTPDPAESATGLVYLEVDSGTLARLDRFEGSQYQRSTVQVACQDGRQRACEAYLLAEPSMPDLTEQPWLLDAFLSGPALARFCARYPGFHHAP